MNMAVSISDSVFDFSGAFHQAIVTTDPSRNTFFSPWSIATAFSIVYSGCKGRTADEIAHVFRLSLLQGVGDAQKLLNDQKNSGTLVQLANKLWINAGFDVRKEYSDLLRSKFQSEVGIANFSGNAEEARQKINTWVGDHTGQKIKDLFPEGSLGAMTRLVIANAVYFKGAWKQPFEKELTASQDFYLADGKSVKVDMMYTNQQLRLIRDKELKCTVVEIPYHGNFYAMLVIIPKDIDGISNLEKRIDGKTIKSWDTNLHMMSADLFMPKFKIEHAIGLKDVLKSLGVESVFTDKADMSNMADERLYISSAFHKAFVEVDEQGTTAGAATGVGINAMSMPPQIKADRPFLFFIREKKTGIPLFSGKIMNPSP